MGKETLHRVENALTNADVTVKSALKMTDEQLLRIPGVGKRGIKALKENYSNTLVSFSASVPANVAEHICAIITACGGVVKK